MLAGELRRRARAGRRTLLGHQLAFAFPEMMIEIERHRRSRTSSPAATGGRVIRIP